MSMDMNKYSLQDDDLNDVVGGGISGKQKNQVIVMGIKTEGNAGGGFLFACQNPACAKAFIITDLNADGYECPYCHKIHISCG